MEKFCCIGVTLAARLIGAFDLSTSILAINFIAGEFFLDEQRLIAFDEITIFLGIRWAKTTTDSQQRLNHKWILICFMTYSVVHLICSATLILATIFKKKAYTMPWLTFEIIGLANQASAVAVHIFQNRCGEGMVVAAYVPLASLYLLLGVYFWLIVFAAQKSWPNETADVFSQADESALVKSDAITLNSPKTPSIYVANHSVFESPDPPVSSRYHEL